MPSNYTGNPIAVEAPSSAPGPGVLPIGALPVDADAINSASIYQPLKVLLDSVAWLNLNGVGGACFGDGSDGTVTMDGTVGAPSWATKSLGTYTMTRDVFCANLTVTGAGVRLETNGFRLYVKYSLTTVGGGIITAQGNAASGAIAGASTNSGTLLPGLVGGTGNAGAGGGSPGTGYGGTSAFYGGAGGVGGLGSGGAGGAAGATSAPGVALGSPRAYATSTLGYVAGAGYGPFTSVLSYLVPVSAGTGGGGGGGGAAANAGGGGGGGAGVLAIAARAVLLATGGDLQALGGTGGNATGTNAGGGGGGGGGALLLAYGSLAITSGSISAAANCAGGAGGSKNGTGVIGSTGAAGQALAMQVA